MHGTTVVNTQFKCAIALSAAAAGLCTALVSSSAAAQAYPAKPVRVVNVAAGSIADSVTRLVFARVAETLGQQFIVDSRPGAGGNIAATFVAKSAADGYTLFLTTQNVLVVNPFLYGNPGFDPLRDFEAYRWWLESAKC